MKTFEERYTAWVDGQLNGNALAACEAELARRAAGGDAEAGRSEALQLRSLLRDHLAAPDLSNAEFFSHQMRARIDAVCGGADARRPAGAWRFPVLNWSLARMCGAGFACLFVAAALYYGLVAGHTGTVNPGSLAQNITPAPAVAPTAGTEVASASPTPAIPAVADPAGPTQLVMISPTPGPSFDADGNDLQARVLDPGAGNSTTATPLHYKDPNVNVLWLDGLNYLPSVPGESPAAASPVADPQPSPAGSIVP